MFEKIINIVLWGPVMWFLIDIFWNKYYAKSPKTDFSVQEIYEDACRTAKSSNPLHMIGYIDSSDIIWVNFTETSWRKYSITLESIKRIAVYIQGKLKKTTFNENELSLESEFFFKNFDSNLPEEQYQILEKSLRNWVKHWWSFSIEFRGWISQPQVPHSTNRRVLYWLVSIPFIIYFVLFGLCLLDIFLISNFKYSFLDLIEPWMQGFYGIMFLVLWIWVPFAISIPIFLIGIFLKNTRQVNPSR